MRPKNRSLPWIPQLFAVALLLGCPSVRSQTVTATISVGTAPEAVAVNKITGKIYVANYLSHSVTVIDSAANSTTTVQAGSHPRAVAVNEATNKMYVANCGGLIFGAGSITVIDGLTNHTTTVVDPNATWPCSLAVNPTTNKIYVGNRLSGNVTVVDGATNSTTTVTDPNASGLGAVAVAINPVTNKIYVANNSTDHGGNNPGNVTVIDGATDLTTTVTDPHAFGPNAVAVNTVTNRVYVTNLGDLRAYSANHGNVTVIDGASNYAVTVSDPNALYPQAVAVNQTANKIYVANGNDPARTGVGGVTVIDGTTNVISTIRDPNAAFPHAVTVDSISDLIYVSNEGCFLDDPCGNPGSVTIINGATNSATTVIDPKAHNPGASAVGPTANKIYVTNGGSNNVTVIDAGTTATSHVLSLVLMGTGSGTITSSPAGIDCTTSCAASFPVGTPVSLSASAASGSHFFGWSGPCSGTGACNVVASEDQFVTATFDSGSMQVAVPNVVGKTQAAASTAITGAGLVVGTVTQQPSSTVASGEIISENPAGGTNVAGGSAVNLAVSTGPMQVAVPNVVGQTQAAATTAITGAGLVLGTVTQQSSTTVTSGDVISESPAAGTNVASGSAVNLVVSTGSSSGGDGGGGALDSLALGALLAALMVRLQFRLQKRAMSS